VRRRRGSFDPVPDPGLRTSSAWHEVEPPRYCGAPAGVAAFAALVFLVLTVLAFVTGCGTTGAQRCLEDRGQPVYDTAGVYLYCTPGGGG